MGKLRQRAVRSLAQVPPTPTNVLPHPLLNSRAPFPTLGRSGLPESAVLTLEHTAAPSSQDQERTCPPDAVPRRTASSRLLPHAAVIQEV